MRPKVCLLGVVCALLMLVLPGSARADGPGPAGGEGAPPALVLTEEAGISMLAFEGGPRFHQTLHAVLDLMLIEVPDSDLRLALWSETDPRGGKTPFYAIGHSGGKMGPAKATSYLLRLRGGAFDPIAGVPPVAKALASPGHAQLYIVQFVTQPLDEFRVAIRQAGGTVLGFLADHAHIVRMDAEARAEVAALPFVRWVGPYHPAYRLEPFLRESCAEARRLAPRERYNILVFEAGPEGKARVAAKLRALGAKVGHASAGKFLLDATLTPEQLYAVAAWDEVEFIDRYSPLELDMDNVRELGGANYVETVAGYTGQGVRGESFDAGFNVNHPDFASRPLLEHGGAVGNDSHGTATTGICFGDGTGDPKARGLLPDGQGIVADYNNIGLTGNDRYTHTGELLEAPYFAVFQTSSVGSSRTTEYTTISADHDTLLFDWDIVHCQSQSNAGSQNSRPQAWAKNVVSGGAVNHYDTLTRDDDCWCNSGSIGPAADGRIKPDLCFFYDDTWTTYSTGDGYGEFGGTSGATPSICGHFGLFFEMWSDGIFGNEADPGGTVFENRPHMTTAKAFMINTAKPYPFTGSDHDLTRVHQGWGNPSAQTLYDMRDNISFVDESVLLTNTESVEFSATVDPGEPALKATMTYADPAGNPSSTQARVNDLTLKLTSPSSVVYWGNNGLLEGNWSIPGGAANTVDTVENVFVENPESGLWLVEVIASEINEDGHVETPELDADFALVVSGAFMKTCSSDGRVSLRRAARACEDEASIRVIDCDLNLDDEAIETTTVTIVSDSEPGGENVVLTETGPLTATFTGTIPLSETDAPGVLLVADLDTITVTYLDADDGMGGTNISKSDDAAIDCSAPVISNVQTENVRARSATVTFRTDEPAKGSVRYGLECATLNETAESAGFLTEHAIGLNGLQPTTTYFYAVDAEDQVGNVSRDDNAGACYSFTTPEIPDFFTEQFESDNDMDFLALTFTPNGSKDFYEACRATISTFPTDPVGGTELSLADDSFEAVDLLEGKSVSLYGVSYERFYVGSNGYITFGTGQSDYSESLSEHFSTPRVAVLYDDLNPSSAGTVSWKQLEDRAVVTWAGVPEYGETTNNDLQIELFFDGTLRVSCLEVTAADGIIGLSDGDGQSPDFTETDLSELYCGNASAPGEAGRATELFVTAYDKGTGVMSLSYGVPCQATGHTIEYAELTPANLSSHSWEGQECALGASGSYDWSTDALTESLFFVIVADNGSDMGSYGQDSAGTERPEDTTSTACPLPQNLGDRCD